MTTSGSRIRIGVRNLRAAAAAEVRIHGRTEHVSATELGAAEAMTFYAETLPRFVAGLPWYGRLFIRMLFQLAAPDVLGDPRRAASRHPVFELTLA